MLSGDDALKPVRVLSGGEKNRLALAKMLLRAFNFLILDEPTNHLDMKSKRVLQQAIQAYEGTVVIVSHDRDFIDPLVNKVIEVSHGGLRTFLGNVSEYAEKVRLEKMEQPVSAVSSRMPKTADKPLSAKERRALSARRLEMLAPFKKRVSLLERKIAQMEEAQLELETRMAQPDFYKDQGESVATLKHYESLKGEIAAAYEEWEAAQEELTLRSEAFSDI